MPLEETATPEDDEAAFEAAFAEFSSPEAAAPAANDEPQQDEPEQPAAEDAPEGDDLVAAADGDAPEEGVDDSLEALQAKLAEAEVNAQKWEEDRKQLLHRAESDRGRVSALQRKLTELETLQKKAAEVEKPAPTADESEALKLLRKQDPELAEVLELQMAQARETMRTELLSEVNQLLSPLQQNMAAQQALLAQQHSLSIEQQMTQAHPDWREVSGSAEFRGWVNRQPPGLQALMSSDDPGDAIYLISEYKRVNLQEKVDTTSADASASADDDAARLAAKRAKQLEDAATVKSSKVAKREAAGGQTFDEAFNYFASKT